MYIHQHKCSSDVGWTSRKRFIARATREEKWMGPVFLICLGLHRRLLSLIPSTIVANNSVRPHVIIRTRGSKRRQRLHRLNVRWRVALRECAKNRVSLENIPVGRWKISWYKYNFAFIQRCPNQISHLPVRWIISTTHHPYHSKNNSFTNT